VGKKVIRVLLIAYAYPPLWEAQSVRWYYLSRELAKAGLEIDVLTIEYPGEIEAYPGIKIYRTFPGPFNRLVYKALSRTSVFSGEVRRSARFRLLKKIYRGVRRTLEGIAFGDTRNEWLPIAYLYALKLIKERNHHLLITSHEPMVDTLLGLILKRKLGIKWIADLGDPICAGYYPAFWKPILRRIERTVLFRADKVLVTNELLREVYAKDFLVPKERLLVITQGFDLEFFEAQKKRDRKRGEKFTLAYTGSFYRGFRDPAVLVESLKKLPFDYELWLAGRIEGFLPAFDGLKDKVKYFGVLPHGKVLELQARADVLIYLGNKLKSQIPGKFYEYLGSRKPILCVVQKEDDPVVKIVNEAKVGVVCRSIAEEISKKMEFLYDLWVKGRLEDEFTFDENRLREFSWQHQAEKILKEVESMLKGLS